MILAIDSTGEEIEVGLLLGEKITVQTSLARPHSRRLLTMIGTILAGHKPNAIAVSVGPGSYTGTRVGVVTANALGWAWKVPVYGIEKKDAENIKILVKHGQTRFIKGDRSSLAEPRYSTIVE